LGLFDTINPVYDPEDEVFRRRLQQKKKRKQGQDWNLSLKKWSHKACGT